MNRLHIDSIVSVGAVEEGDNQPASIMFWKRRMNQTNEPAPGPVEKERTTMPFDIDALPDDAQEYVRGLESELASLRSAGEEAPSLPDDLPDVVAKRLEAQDDAIAKERVEKERIAKELADLREERATEKYTAIAQELRPIMGDPAETMPVLKALGTADPQAFDALYGRMRPLVNLSGYENVLKEYGTSAAEGSAIDKINAAAAEIRKANPGMSFADAKAQAWRDNPELKRQSREEG